jgi:hypothetical protein
MKVTTCSNKRVYYTAGKMLTNALSKNEMIRLLGGRMAEQVVFNESYSIDTIFDNSKLFTMAVDKVLESGGEVEQIIRNAENECFSLIEENRSSLDIIASRLENGQITPYVDIVQLVNAEIDWDFEF